MRPATALLLALSSSLAAGTPVRGAAAGGPAWCTVDTAAQGAALYQRTKDCCAASGGSNARFNEVDELCEGILGAFVLSSRLPLHPAARVPAFSFARHGLTWFGE
jgi:hypothetical protein